MNVRQLPQDRLSTTDETGKRVYLYPADVKGRYRTARSWVSVVLIVVFLVLPWVRIGGNPAVLLDLPNRRFSILGVMFWAHDAPMLFFVAAGAIMCLAFVTAVWGRAWCGWACPQTVFVDSVFRRIERAIEGEALKRKRRDQGPWSSEKVMLKSAKWAVFTLVSLMIGHSFLAYFVGTERLAVMMASSPAKSPESFLVMAVVSGGVLFDFGWFREQFCTVLCPYGRFQSVLMDERSLVVAYDDKRPDCIDCFKCVAACPTGIDIRRGPQQLECIACTACIDACDDVMRRVRKPEGLIRYLKPTLLRPRTLIYLGLILALMAGLVATVRGRTGITADFVRAIGAPYEEATGPAGVPLVINHFKLDLRNQAFETMQPSIELPAELKERGAELVMAAQPSRLPAGETLRLDLFVRFPRALLHDGKGVIPIRVSGAEESITQEVKLVGPLN
jgi:cytochrome c oxidase accessory protein FixG